MRSWPGPCKWSMQAGAEAPGPGPDHRRHHGAAQGREPSDRCQARAAGDREAGDAGQGGRPQGAAILQTARQARGADGAALHPCQAVQAGEPGTEVPGHPPRPADPGHHAQDCGEPEIGRSLRLAAEQGAAHPLAEPAPARPQALFLACPPRSSASGRAKPTSPTSSGSKSPSLPPTGAARAASSSSTPRRYPAIHTMGTRSPR